MTENDPEMYKLVVLIPMDLTTEQKEDFFLKITDAAYEEEDRYPDRTWDIFCYAGPESHDK